MFRRVIGRNQVALTTDSDLVFFTDVDHCFGWGCLDELEVIWNDLKRAGPLPVMVWPHEVLVQASFDDADCFWNQSLEMKGVLHIPPYHSFVATRYYRAIGGVQIVNGDFARKYGYLNGHAKWQSPISPDKPFPSFRDDVKFRRFCEASGCCFSIPLKNLYRLRHTKVTYR